MNRRRIGRILVALTAALGVFALVGPTTPAANAECLAAEVYLTKSGSTSRQYLVGPRRCLAPTPFTVWLQPNAEEQVGGVKPGLPNGAGFRVWVPGP